MDILTHANTLPWLIDPAGFLTLLNYSLDALALSLLSLLLYAGLHRLLSHPVRLEEAPSLGVRNPLKSGVFPPKADKAFLSDQPTKGVSGTFSMTNHRQEPLSHEA
jgi:hypothetical protein